MKHLALFFFLEEDGGKYKCIPVQVHFLFSFFLPTSDADSVKGRHAVSFIPSQSPISHLHLHSHPHILHLLPQFPSSIKYSVKHIIIMADTSATTAKCTTCAKPRSDCVSLKRCGICQITRYCSKECQIINWRAHKQVCASIAMSAGPQPSPEPAGTGNTPFQASPSLHHPNQDGNIAKGLVVDVDKPFHRLNAKMWLHGRPERDVFKLLIDTYRLRMDDNMKAGEVDADSVYGASSDGQGGFRRFLCLAEEQAGLLPSWWSQEKAVECTDLGLSGGWSSLASAVGKSEIVEHYGSPVMPMQLRMFGEQVYKTGPGGQSGATMMRLQMQAEKGGTMTSHLSFA